MINETTIKVPKKYHDMIDQVFRDEDGYYWVYIKEGFWCGEMQSTSIHEKTQREVLALIRTIEVDPNFEEKAETEVEIQEEKEVEHIPTADEIKAMTTLDQLENARDILYKLYKSSTTTKDSKIYYTRHHICEYRISILKQKKKIQY